jgi:hypothetical protein
MRERQGSRMLPENRTALQVDALDATPSLHVPPVVADEFVEGYICWREECVAVESAYEQWRGIERRDRPVAYAAYLAALDREEHAALVFRDCAERVFGATM